MAKSLLLLVLSYLDLSQGSRSSSADATPLAGSQMLQLKKETEPDAGVDSAGNPKDATPGQLMQFQSNSSQAWTVVYSNAKKTCADTGNVLTWNAGVETAEECKQACVSWGDEHVNQNSHRTCAAAYFFHKPDGTAFCRLFETCDTCKGSEFAGTTFTTGDVCSAFCSRPDCSRDDGFKPKPDFRGIACAGSMCTHDECCDLLPGWTTTAAPTTPPPTRRRAPTRRRRSPMSSYNWRCPNWMSPGRVYSCSSGLTVHGTWHPYGGTGCAAGYPSNGCFIYGGKVWNSNCGSQQQGDDQHKVVCQGR